MVEEHAMEAAAQAGRSEPPPQPEPRRKINPVWVSDEPDKTIHACTKCASRSSSH